MADIRVSALPALTAPADDDILHAVDTSASADSKLSIAELKKAVGAQFDPGRWIEFTTVVGSTPKLRLLPAGGMGSIWIDKKDGSALKEVPATRQREEAPPEWLNPFPLFPGPPLYSNPELATAKTFRVYVPPAFQIYEMSGLRIAGSSGAPALAGRFYASGGGTPPAAFTDWNLSTCMIGTLVLDNFADTTLCLDFSSMVYASLGKMASLVSILIAGAPRGTISLWGAFPELTSLENYDNWDGYSALEAIELAVNASIPANSGSAPKLANVLDKLIGPMFHTLRTPGCAYTANTLNKLLPAINAKSKLSNGYIDVSGGTSVAIPAGSAAETAVTALKARGWTVKSTGSP
jgi:hypothetical protein